ncbi:hypothetical protein [Lactovum odontotermitis]
MDKKQNQPNSTAPNSKKSNGTLDKNKKPDPPITYSYSTDQRNKISIKNEIGQSDFPFTSPDKPKNIPETDRHIDHSTN